MKSISYFFFVVFFLLIGACSHDVHVSPGPPPNNTASKQITFIQDKFEGIPVVLVGSPGLNFIVSFERTLDDGSVLSFDESSPTLSVILEDNEGNKWDLAGYAVEGPREGQRLKPTYSYMGYWFAFGAVFPGIELFDGPDPEDNIQVPPPEPEWTISTDFVFSGAGKDGIPAIDVPQFIQFREKDFLDGNFYVKDNDLVVGIKIGGKYRLYPHNILNWHEIVNDEVSGIPISVSFCPLTGTATAWKRTLNSGNLTTFGVSGLLYNSNLMPYDRKTSSVWSQMRMECVNGDLLGEKLEFLPVIETTWATWKSLLGLPIVMSTETGHNKNYFANPYGSYPTDNDLIAFPVEYRDKRLPAKERVHAIIINGKAKAYRLSDFGE